MRTGHMSMLRTMLRFRLRSLFIAMSLLAAVAAFVARPVQAYRQERHALSQIPGSRQITKATNAVQVCWPSGRVLSQRIPVFL